MKIGGKKVLIYGAPALLLVLGILILTTSSIESFYVPNWDLIMAYQTISRYKEEIITPYINEYNAAPRREEFLKEWCKANGDAALISLCGKIEYNVTDMNLYEIRLRDTKGLYHLKKSSPIKELYFSSRFNEFILITEKGTRSREISSVKVVNRFRLFAGFRKSEH
ncbi:hypothetical protein KAI78_11010 [bacterium]|nr:hypothetical protein [bacterium]